MTESVRFANRVRSPEDLRRLAEFEHRIYLPLMLAAILPIVTAASNSADDSWVSIAVNVLAWLVFVASAFGLSTDTAVAAPPEDEQPPADAILAELAELRRQLANIEEHVTG